MLLYGNIYVDTFKADKEISTKKVAQRCATSF